MEDRIHLHREIDDIREIIKMFEKNYNGTDVCNFKSCEGMATNIVKLPLGNNKVCILHLCDECLPKFRYHKSRQMHQIRSGISVAAKLRTNALESSSQTGGSCLVD